MFIRFQLKKNIYTSFYHDGNSLCVSNNIMKRYFWISFNSSLKDREQNNQVFFYLPNHCRLVWVKFLQMSLHFYNKQKKILVKLNMQIIILWQWNIKAGISYHEIQLFIYFSIYTNYGNMTFVLGNPTRNNLY